MLKHNGWVHAFAIKVYMKHIEYKTPLIVQNPLQIFAVFNTNSIFLSA